MALLMPTADGALWHGPQARRTGRARMPGVADLQRTCSAPAGVGEDVEGNLSTNSMGHLIAPAAQGLQRFWAWFSGSKLLDDHGRPQVLFHATARDFQHFVPGGLDATVSGPAIWLSPYADHQAAAHNVGARGGGFRAGARVIAVYACIARPLMLDGELMLNWAREAYADGSENFPQLLAPPWVQALRADGYDGIFFDGPGVGWGPRASEVVAFEGDQLLSVLSGEPPLRRRCND